MTARMLHALDARHRLRLTPLQRFEATSGRDPGRRELLARLHARSARGEWFAGGDAVLSIAAVIPLLVPLSFIGRLPGVGRAVERAYDLVADNREPIGRWLGVDRCRIDPNRLRR